MKDPNYRDDGPQQAQNVRYVTTESNHFGKGFTQLFDITCPHCQKEQTARVPEPSSIDRFIMTCRKCRKSIEL
jgi:protein-disulfide isomerase